MKIAIVHDDLIQFGGAEKVLMAFHEIWPDAPIFTSFASGEWLSICKKENIDLKTSFMQKLPNINGWYKYYALMLFYPIAFELFDFSDFDVVLSTSSRFAHGVVTKPKTFHICYMHSPGRMFWETENYFENENVGKGFVKKLARGLAMPALSYMRMWDYTVSQRVDKFIANSTNVKRKIERFYNRESAVLHPFCDVSYFSDSKELLIKEPYFLILSRLSSWKKLDIAVEACTKLGASLVVIGDGPDRKRLEKMAGPTVKFLGFVSEENKKGLLKGCRALLFPQSEDFGITPLEAMACGKPVIAYKDGGALETIIEGKTGEFFYPQTSEALALKISQFDQMRYNSEDCAGRALSFNKPVFMTAIKNLVEQTYVQNS